MKKYYLLLIVLAVALAAGAAYFYYHSSQPAGQNSGSLPQPMTGTLVSIATSTITVASEDGTQRIFKVTPMTPVISVVASGQTGQTLSQLSVGVNVTVTPETNDPA